MAARFLAVRHAIVIACRYFGTLPLFVTVFVITTIAWTCLSIIVPEVYSSSYFKSFFYITGLVTVINIFYHLYQTCTSTLKTTENFNLEAGVPLKVCTKCRTNIPYDAHHCKICDLCVLKHDHHCLLLNRCIAEGNVESFYSFIQSCSFGLFSLLLTSIPVLLNWNKYTGNLSAIKASLVTGTMILSISILPLLLFLIAFKKLM